AERLRAHVGSHFPIQKEAGQASENGVLNAAAANHNIMGSSSCVPSTGSANNRFETTRLLVVFRAFSTMVFDADASRCFARSRRRRFQRQKSSARRIRNQQIPKIRRRADRQI